MNSFLAKTDYYKELVEDGLREALPQEKASEKVLKAMRYSLLGGGKRIRGTIALACFELFSDKIEIALPSAVAIEMVHAYSLIHDDLPCMDNDDMRRGKPSCHVAFGEAVAMLAGDALLTRGIGILSEISDSAAALKCIKSLTEAAGFSGMIRGQELDIGLGDRRQVKRNEINRVYSLKTGKMYTSAAYMGAVLGNSSEEDLATIEEAMEKIGLAFQIIDDILDAPTETNTKGNDEDKVTYLSLYNKDNCIAVAEKLTEEAIEILNNRFKSKAWFISQLAENLLTRTK